MKVLLFISIGLNLILLYSAEKGHAHNEELLWENINLRGYKDVYLNHIDKCDTIHKNCVRMDNTQMPSATLTVSPCYTLTCKGCRTETVVCNGNKDTSYIFK